nr:hypothetical protein [Tanacetum cinerariifolium]
MKKRFKTIGLGYESIRACINDFFLFWGDTNKNEDNFPIYGASRWKDLKTKGKKVANKVVHYFPLKPRAQRMYSSQHTTKNMTWHATGQSKDVGKDIDVYLQTYVVELHTLWKDRVRTRDVATNTHFTMKVALLWTINVFHARSRMSRKWLRVSHQWRKKHHASKFNEAIQGGPNCYSWMYLFGRYMNKLKNYVRIRAKPEGSIAEAYIAKKALTYYSRYLKGVETKFNHLDRNEDGVNVINNLQVPVGMQPLGKETRQVFYLDDLARRPLHWKIVKDVNHTKSWQRDTIVVEDNEDVIHQFFTCCIVDLDDLDFADMNDVVIDIGDDEEDVDVESENEVEPVRVEVCSSSDED